MGLTTSDCEANANIKNKQRRRTTVRKSLRMPIGFGSTLKSFRKNLPILFLKNREISLFYGPSTWKLCSTPIICSDIATVSYLLYLLLRRTLLVNNLVQFSEQYIVGRREWATEAREPSLERSARWLGFFSVPNPTAAQNNKHDIGNRHNIWAATCESRGQTIISTEDRHLFSATQTYAAPPLLSKGLLWRNDNIQ